QRVMDCGDAGHILLSRHVAEDLAEYERWRPILHDIGTFEVKHGVRVSVTNLYSDEVGNPNLPSKLQAVKKHHAHVRWAAVAIGRTLHVAHGLEGSVRKAGNAVRITAQLIRTGTDTHLWSQTYDRKLDDIFAIQDEIAADVVKQLKVTLLGAAPKARTTDPEAYALYLQAVQLGRQFTAEAFQQSGALLRKVLATDSRYAPAWDGLATNLANEAGQGLMPSKEGYAQAREADMKALAIDPDYAPAPRGLG